jgi:hypothetical protein
LGEVEKLIEAPQIAAHDPQVAILDGDRGKAHLAIQS